MFFNLKKLLIFLAIALVFTNSLFSSALAATHDFQLHGRTGYLVKGTFDYDEVTEGEIISVTGGQKSDRLHSLIVSFYDPQGKLLCTYNNIVDHTARGNYLELHFDTHNQQLVGNLDLGGEIAGEMYVKGNVADELNLIEVDSSERERVVDSFATF
ncbi:MAG: hypothetical protein ACFCU5_16195 [Pleurocapsa sp.]